MNKAFMLSFKKAEECDKKPGGVRCNISRYLARKGLLSSPCHACAFHQKNPAIIKPVDRSPVSC